MHVLIAAIELYNTTPFGTPEKMEGHTSAMRKESATRRRCRGYDADELQINMGQTPRGHHSTGGIDGEELQ
jgi:hypothetical protein